MTAAAERARTIEALAACLRGDRVPFRALGTTDGELLEICATEGIAGVLYRHVAEQSKGDWPEHVRQALEQEAYASAAQELLVRRELVAVLNALAAADIHPILLKGAALAYLVYGAPGDRPRADTDLLIPSDRVDATRSVLTALGYEPSVLCGGDLFCQFEMAKTDSFGVHHALDCHWKISTQPVFADMLTFDELDAEAVAIPRLDSLARTAGPVHALFLACLHPAMHHRNLERLIWLYDVHLLASGLSESQLTLLLDLAIAKRASTVVGHALQSAKLRFRTPVPARALSRLEGQRHEPSAAYLRVGRRWHDEFFSSLRGLPAWPDRLRLVKQVALPDASYMLKSYGLESSLVGTALLPTLYAHRGIKGVLKVLTGRK